MKPQNTPNFSFSRDGKRITCWFNNHPQKTNEGKEKHLAFSRDCESELEAILLQDYLQEFQHLIHKEYFTRGFDAHKQKQKNWYI